MPNSLRSQSAGMWIVVCCVSSLVYRRPSALLRGIPIGGSWSAGENYEASYFIDAPRPLSVPFPTPKWSTDQISGFPATQHGYGHAQASLIKPFNANI